MASPTTTSSPPPTPSEKAPTPSRTPSFFPICRPPEVQRNRRHRRRRLQRQRLRRHARQRPGLDHRLYGNAVNLAAASSQYLTLPAGVVNGLGNFTISAWVKLNSTANNTRIFDFGTGTANYFELCPKNGNNGFFRFEAVKGGVVRQTNTTYSSQPGRGRTWQ